MIEFRWKTYQVRNSVHLVLKITIYTGKKILKKVLKAINRKNEPVGWECILAY